MSCFSSKIIYCFSNRARAGEMAVAETAPAIVCTSNDWDESAMTRTDVDGYRLPLRLEFAKSIRGDSTAFAIVTRLLGAHAVRAADTDPDVFAFPNTSVEQVRDIFALIPGKWLNEERDEAPAARAASVAPPAPPTEAPADVLLDANPCRKRARAEPATEPAARRQNFGRAIPDGALVRHWINATAANRLAKDSSLTSTYCKARDALVHETGSGQILFTSITAMVNYHCAKNQLPDARRSGRWESALYYRVFGGALWEPMARLAKVAQ